MENRENWQAEIRLELQRKDTARHILGVCESDSSKEIKRIWRKLSIEHHPDRNEGSSESHRMIILVNAAYNCLVNARDCSQLDAEHSQDKMLTDGKYLLDNSWGYFLWWREKYFDNY